MPGQKEAQPAGADSDQQLSPFLAQLDTLIRQAQPHPSRALFQSKGGREREGCPQPACAYWLAPWGRVQSSRQDPALSPTLRHTDAGAKMKSQECSPTTQGLTDSLESGVLPGSARSLQGVQKTAVASLGQGKWWV